MIRTIELDKQEQTVYDLIVAKTAAGRLAWKRSGPGAYYAEFGGDYGYRIDVTSALPWTVEISIRQGDHYLKGFVVNEIELYRAIMDGSKETAAFLEKALDILNRL